jgi:uncharacterized protein YndB with AHSA1/START domain
MSDSNSRRVVVVYRYAASAERVYDAWLDPNRAGKFLFATPAGSMVRIEIDARIGGKFLFVDRRDGQDIEHVGKYIELERPKRIVFDFAVPKFSSIFTRVSIDIRPLEAGCELTLTHDGVLPEYETRTNNGWKMILKSLDTSLAAN